MRTISGSRTRGMMIVVVAVLVAATSCSSEGGKDVRSAAKDTAPPKRPAVSATATAPTTAAPAAPPSTAAPTSPSASGSAPPVSSPASQPTTTGVRVPSHPGSVTPVPQTVAPTDDKSLAVAKVRSVGRYPSNFAGFGTGGLEAITTNRQTADGKGIQVYFFDHGRFVGTDSAQESIDAQITASTADTITIGYRLYGADDPLCCPTSTVRSVRFRLAGGRLAALDPIPPISGPSHR